MLEHTKTYVRLVTYNSKTYKDICVQVNITQRSKQDSQMLCKVNIQRHM